jgi:hypothetical protein
MLSLASILLPWLARSLADQVDGLTLYAVWNSALVAWVVVLIHMRSRQNPRRDWAWTYPVAVALLVLNWLSPLAWYVGLLYAHPVIALWMLDRELYRRHPDWRRAYHACLLCLPVLLALLWWQLVDTAPFPGDDGLTVSIAQGAGAGIFEGISAHALVATQAFLTMVHYGVWVIAMPLVGLSARPWQVKAIPLAGRSFGFRRGIAVLLAVGAGVVLLLWGGFLADYQLAREIYVNVAIVHILAEVPFLLRAL